MHTRFLTAVALSAAIMAGGPAAATDTSSLSAFLASCSSDSKGCQTFTQDLVTSARNAHYGCIPKALGTEDAGGELLAWLKGPASANAKYQKMSLEDVMWDGVDSLWPCK
jgi:hypothetical protein